MMLSRLEQVIANPANRRYGIAEVAAITGSYVAAFSTSWHLQDQGASEGIEATLTYAAKTVAYYGTNFGTYIALFVVQGERGSYRETLKRLFETNIVTTLVHALATISTHYTLAKSNMIAQEDVAPIVYPTIGVACLGLKQILSYKVGLFGKEKTVQKDE